MVFAAPFRPFSAAFSGESLRLAARCEADVKDCALTWGRGGPMSVVKALSSCALIDFVLISAINLSLEKTGAASTAPAPLTTATSAVVLLCGNNPAPSRGALPPQTPHA